MHVSSSIGIAIVIRLLLETVGMTRDTYYLVYVYDGKQQAPNNIQHFPQTRAFFFVDGTQEVILQHKYTHMGASLLTECTDGTQKKIKKIPDHQ
jgi:hypothetical protein